MKHVPYAPLGRYLALMILFLSSSMGMSWGRELPPQVEETLKQSSLRQLLQGPSNLIDIPLQAYDVPVVADALWKKYLQEEGEDTLRKEEWQKKEMRFQNHTMRYTWERLGERPEGGYPLYVALHGGGGAPTWVNDGQWQHMQVYYKDSVKQGIYVAPRGVSDTWDLHFRPESYVLYDRLIENMILYGDVNPNRVYFLGFSAGGDGIYQISPRMSDRLAAANMSAGHPNGVSLKNLFNLPFLIQVGEMDSAYGRNKVSAEDHLKLESLRQEYPQGYRHETFIHAGRPHNFLDNDSGEAPQSVLASPAKWLAEGDRSVVSRNTNAVTWLSQFARNPLPEKIIWDLKTRADRRAPDLWPTKTRGQQHYWLDIGDHTAESLGIDEVVVRVDRAQNALVVEKAKTYLKILVSGRLLDLSHPVQVLVHGSGENPGEVQKWTVDLRPNFKHMVKTLYDRGDIHNVFESELVLKESGGQWELAHSTR